MFIKKIISQHRRDFTALYACEHCAHEREGSGYDDTNFHSNVVPDMVCPKCSNKADKETHRGLAPKYGDNQVV